MRRVVVIGAGLSGLSFARRYLELNPEAIIDIYESEEKIGGNLSEIEIDGTIVHEHGPHVFHTKSERIWNFINKFSEFTPYVHYVTGMIEGKNVPIPFNFESIDIIFGEKIANTFKEKLIKIFGFGSRVSIYDLKNNNDEDLIFLGNYIFENVFKKYSEKQWGVKVEEINESVLKRVPVCISYDGRYFVDKYQYIPKIGYNKLIKNMADHPNIEIYTNSKKNYNNISLNSEDILVNTSPVDEFFDYKYGVLDYRSLKFNYEKSVSEFLGIRTAGTNFPSMFDFTRVTRYGFIPSQTNSYIYGYEISQKHVIGENHRYYPINNDKNDKIFKKYKELANEKNVYLCGRLALYKYYNMDQAIGSAIKLAENLN